MANETMEFMDKKFDKFEIFGKPAMFSDCRLICGLVPDGLYVYDLREHDESGMFGEIKNYVYVNYGGTIITKDAIEGDTKHGIAITPDDYNFVGDGITVKEFLSGTTESEEETEEETLDDWINAED